MKAFVAVVSSLVAAAQGQYAVPYGYNFAAPNVVAQAPIIAQAPIVAAAPQVYATAPAPVVPAPLAAPSSQFQAQDEFGNLNYGYSNINSQKHEVGNAYGGVTGAYSYVDANGEVQRVEYVADELGFRVKATNLPVAPDAPVVAPLEAPVYTGEAPVFEGEAPVQVDDTEEVKAAKAAFFERFEEEAARTKRDADAQLALPYAAGLPYAGAYGLPYAGLPYAAAPAYAGLAPVVAKTPAATVKAVHAVTAPVAVAPALAYAQAPVVAAAPAPVAYAQAAPVAYAQAAPVAYAQAAPVAYATAPAAPGVESTLTITKLNPGHATAYRVD